MKEQIKALVKTAYSKFGLKEASLEKLVNIIEQKVNAMGTLEPDKLTEAINSQIEAHVDMLGLIQSEVDSRVTKPVSKPPIATLQDQEKKKEIEQDDVPQWAKDLQKQNEDLMLKLEAADKQKTLDQIKKQALDIAKTKGADNEKLLSKVMRLVDIEDGHTAEQVAEKLVSEYSELYTTTNDGVVPSFQSNQKLDGEALSKLQEEGAKSRAKELMENKTC